MGTINGQKDPKVSLKKKVAAKKKSPKKKTAVAAGPTEPAPGKTGKVGQGTTYLEIEDGEKHTTEWVPSATVPGGTLTANVNVSAGARIGLPNYSDVRCGASLTIPCAAVPEEIDKAFEWANDWVEERVQAMVDENTPESE